MFKRIYIEITNICNLNCDFCPNSNKKKKSMSLDEFKLVINKIKGYTKNIYLHVKGEPFMHENIDSIIEVANQNDILVNITTNGRLLSNNIDMINNRNIRQINISLHSYNDISEIINLLNTIDKIKNTYISLRLWNDKDNLEIIKLLESHYNKKIVLDKRRFTLTDMVFIDRDSLFDWPDIKKDVITKMGTCLGLKSQIGILSDGTVVPCCLDQDGIINLGNIYNETLDEILNKDFTKSIIKGFDDNKLVCELCKRCQYRERFK